MKKMNPAGNKKGIVLLEAVVAFVILLIGIVGVTALVMASINLNNKAQDTNTGMETSIKAVEQYMNGGTPAVTDTGTVSATVSGVSVSIPVNISEEGQLVFFRAK
ncbi:MAG: hypothetical protein LKJ83_03810 [Eubacteriaceae bacterium]|jgi:Tfp pilus assembly protein PilV|nr:hypothetical protein [Eubacteriaceae bacterium]